MGDKEDARKARYANTDRERMRWYDMVGLCTKCGNDMQSATSKWCKSCAAKQSKMVMAREKRLVANGLCRKCGKKPFMSKSVSYCAGCYEPVLRRAKAWHKPYLKMVFDHYGRKCACCGETEPMFLTIDHVNNDGNVERKAIRSNALPKHIVDSGFPKSYQILCYNCNCGKHRNGGVCPHTKKGDFL